jgi:hypothetical protein
VVTYTRTNVMYDYAIEGQPLLSAASKAFPYKRETADFRKEQFDNSNDPGEQSLRNWWVRSQRSWHYGADTRYQEPANDEQVMASFLHSEGIDSSTPGEFRLLPELLLKKNLDVAIPEAGHAASGIFNNVAGTPTVGFWMTHYVSGTGQLFKYIDDATNTATAVTYDAGLAQGIVSDMIINGTHYFIVDSQRIFRGALPSGAGAVLYGPWATTTKSILGWVKQRLVAAVGASIYELVAAGPALPPPIYTHPDANWEWTCFSEGPAAIYASGHNGYQSSIYKFVLSASGSMPTLSQGVIACQLPQGELVYSVLGYLGKFIVMLTSKGVRVGEMQVNGDIDYGPLTVAWAKMPPNGTPGMSAPTTGFDKNSLTAVDRFIYVGLLGNPYCVIKIDLSRQKDDGTFAWSNDLQARLASAGLIGVGQCCGIGAYGTTGKLWLANANGGADGGFYLQGANYEATGFLKTPLVRFNTVDNKRFKFLRTQTNNQPGQVVIKTRTATGALTTVATVAANTATGNADIDLARASPEELLGFDI